MGRGPSSSRVGRRALDSRPMPPATRRRFLGATATSAAALGLSRALRADDALGSIRAEVTKRHDENIERLQAWVKQPSIAAENRGMNEGCEAMITLARDAGLQSDVEVSDRRLPERLRDPRRGRQTDDRRSTSCTT